ncbi:hypothetical protein U1Q18_022161, partial [Sarracenia purpurea var. burkii]
IKERTRPLVSIYGDNKRWRWLHRRTTGMAPSTSDDIGATTGGRRISNADRKEGGESDMFSDH